MRALLKIGAALLTSAALGFLGVAARPPSPEWGSMLAMANTYYLGA